jgi:hypothetical protein
VIARLVADVGAVVLSRHGTILACVCPLCERGVVPGRMRPDAIGQDPGEWVCEACVVDHDAHSSPDPGEPLPWELGWEPCNDDAEGAL